MQNNYVILLEVKNVEKWCGYSLGFNIYSEKSQHEDRITFAFRINDMMDYYKIIIGS